MDGRLKRDDTLAHTKSGILCLFRRGVVAMGFKKRQHGANQSMSVFSFSFFKRRASIMIEQGVSNG